MWRPALLFTLLFFRDHWSRLSEESVFVCVCVQVFRVTFVCSFAQRYVCVCSGVVQDARVHVHLCEFDTYMPHCQAQ